MVRVSLLSVELRRRHSQTNCTAFEYSTVRSIAATPSRNCANLPLNFITKARGFFLGFPSTTKRHNFTPAHPNSLTHSQHNRANPKRRSSSSKRNQITDPWEEHTRTHTHSKRDGNNNNNNYDYLLKKKMVWNEQ